MKKPCNPDHNGECLICDCTPKDCAWDWLWEGNFQYESFEELLVLFQDHLDEVQVQCLRTKYGYQEFDPPRDHSDEKYTQEEYRTPPESIPQQVDHFIRYFGMKRLLEEMIASTKAASRDEKTNWPTRDSSYLDKLADDLNTTLKNYEGRYPGEPDYYEGEPKEEGETEA